GSSREERRVGGAYKTPGSRRCHLKPDAGPGVGPGRGAGFTTAAARAGPMPAGRPRPPEAPASAHLGDLHAVQALGQGAGVAALGELDAQAHLVLRVGVAQGVLVGDLA